MPHRKKLTLPVPSGFFLCPQLTSEARRQYIRQGQERLVELVQKTQLRNGPIDWKFDHEVSGVRVYRGLDHSQNSAAVYLNVTEIDASLEESADLMSAGDGSRDYCATHLRDDILDSHPLYTISTPSEEHPHNAVTIKWRVLNMKNPLLKNRDMVLMEYQDDFSINGIQGFARCLSSVDVGDACPSLEDSFGLVRAHFHLDGEIFMESKRPGCVSVRRIYQSDMQGSLPQWLTMFFAKGRVAKCFSQMDEHFRHERLSRATPMFLHPEELLPLESRTHCGMCYTKFLPLARKTNCYLCGDVFCKKCNPLWNGGGPITMLDASSAGARVCRGCSSSSSAHVNQTPTTSSEQSFASTTTSSRYRLDSRDSSNTPNSRLRPRTKHYVQVKNTSPHFNVSVGARYEVEINREVPTGEKKEGMKTESGNHLWKNIEEAEDPAKMLDYLKQLQVIKRRENSDSPTEKRQTLIQYPQHVASAY